MTQATLIVTLVNVSLHNAKGLFGDVTVIQLKVGTDAVILTGKGKSFQSKEVAILKCEKQLLDIYAYSQGNRDSTVNVVHGQVNLAPLFNLPKKRHIINVQTIYEDDGILRDESSGSIDIQIIYSEVLDSVLEVEISSAELIRDTQVVGKMDPYSEVTLEEITKKTTVKDNAGKTPVWNQQFLFILKKPDSKLLLSVKDQDVTTSDLVGTAELSLREKGLLKPSGEWSDSTLEIFYKEKVSGLLRIRTKFQIFYQRSKFQKRIQEEVPNVHQTNQKQSIYTSYVFDKDLCVKQGTSIWADGKKVKRTENHDQYGYYTLVCPSLQVGSSVCKIEVIARGECGLLGIGYKQTLMSKGFKDRGGSGLQEGVYLVRRDGYTYSHYRKNQDCKQGGLRFSADDRIVIEVDFEQCRMVVSNKSRQESKKVSVDFERLEGNPLHFVVKMWGNNEEFEICQ